VTELACPSGWGCLLAPGCPQPAGWAQAGLFASSRLARDGDARHPDVRYRPICALAVTRAWPQRTDDDDQASGGNLAGRPYEHDSSRWLQVTGPAPRLELDRQRCHRIIAGQAATRAGIAGVAAALAGRGGWHCQPVAQLRGAPCDLARAARPVGRNPSP
jgi:hypothetical protein